MKTTLQERIHCFIHAGTYMESRREVKALELAEHSLRDKYAEVAHALGFELVGWFNDPKATHEEIVEKAKKCSKP